MATDADALALLNGYGVRSLGYELSDAEIAGAIPYWKGRIEALGWDGAIMEARTKAAQYAAARPVVVPVKVSNPAHAESFSVSPGVLIIGALAAYFLLKGK